MSEEIANHSDESPIEIERDAATEALFDSFGIAPKAEKKDVEFPKMDEPTEPLTTEEEEEVHTETTTPEKRTIKVKYNGEDKEVGEDEAPSLIQKGMNYDKVQQKLADQQKALDEVAQLQGYKDHAELIADLPKLREQQQQNQKNELDALRKDMLDQLEENGVDREKAEQWINSHPLIKQGEEAIAARQKEAQQADEANKWQPLYQAYPELAEAVKKANGQPVDWYTPELDDLVKRGNDPLLAYEHLNKDKIQTQTKKSTEQRLIKEQQLGVRSAAAGQPPALESEVSLLPSQMALAEEFGVTAQGVQRQQQLIKNRR